MNWKVVRRIDLVSADHLLNLQPHSLQSGMFSFACSILAGLVLDWSQSLLS